MAKVGPGQAIGREIATGDAADKELNRFVERRHEQREKSEGEAAETEALWTAASRLHEARRRREARAGWYGWHVHRAELYARLSAEHEAAAEGLMEETDERRMA